MGLSTITGPSIVSGNIDPLVNRVPEQGPSLTFQGSGVLDPRYVGNIGAAPGKLVYGFYANPYFALVDFVPSAAAPARVAALQATTLGVAMALAVAQGVGISPNLPVVPFGLTFTAANAVVAPLTLDFGFTTGNTTAGSKNIAIPAGAWKFFQAGEALAVSGAGASTALPLKTTVAVTPLPNATVVVVNDAPGQTVANAQIGNLDPSLSSVWAYVTAGQIALADSSQSLIRGLSVTCSGAGPGGVVTVRGWDMYGQPMSEAITVGAGAITAYSKKTFKQILSVTPNFTSAVTYSVGTSDLFGFTVRADFWEYLQVFVAGAFLSVNTGFTAADATAPATSVTGAVRGTLQVGTLGPLGAGAAGGPMDGVKRLAAFMSMPVYNAIGANNLAYSTMFGTQEG